MPDMANVCLNAIVNAGFEVSAVIPPPKSNPTSGGFINFAKSLGLNVICYDEDPNCPEIIKQIASYNADIGVICSFDKLLKKDFLNTTSSGYINCHPSLLPHYRGANPYFHIINNNEKTTGITLHFADEHFDTGDIIAQKGFMLLEKETIGTLFNRSNFMIADMLVKVLSDFEKTGKIDSRPQTEGNFKKAPKIFTDIRLDLNKSNDGIERLIRAANPFYNVYLIFRGAPIKIFCADFKKKKHSIEAGIIMHVDKDRFGISTREGFIYPKTLQSGSWGIFDAQNFISIFSPQTGEVFN